MQLWGSTNGSGDMEGAEEDRLLGLLSSTLADEELAAQQLLLDVAHDPHADVLGGLEHHAVAALVHILVSHLQEQG
eukprot:10038902-Alexandrium_andersonii.AAC.2